MWGILFIIFFGSLLHFIFELSGGKPLVVIIGAVNESVWEHLKIGFWPAFIWAVVEYFIFGKKLPSFFMAKGFSIILISLLISGIYYLSVFLKIESLPVNIANFVISVFIAQVLSYRLLIIQKRNAILKIIGIILLVLNLAAFSLLSYFPPKFPIFRDPVTGGYGITNI